MSYFIIIRGPLGVGKSTIAKKLAKILHAEYVSIDTVLEKYGLDKVKIEKWIPAKNFIKATEIILPKIKEKLSHGKILILEANFYHKKQIEHLVQNLSFPRYAFTLKAPLEVCIRRDSKRKKTLGKEATEAVYKLVSCFDYGTIIDTNKKTIDKIVKEIISYIDLS